MNDSESIRTTKSPRSGGGPGNTVSNHGTGRSKRPFVPPVVQSFFPGTEMLADDMGEWLGPREPAPPGTARKERHGNANQQHG